jgi:signal transduction histidine kinase
MPSRPTTKSLRTARINGFEGCCRWGVAILVWLWALRPMVLFGQTAIVDAQFRGGPLSGLILNDKTGNFSIDSMLTGRFQSLFVGKPTSSLIAGTDTTRWWFYVEVDNRETSVQALVLTFNRKNYDSWQLFQRLPDGAVVQQPAVGAAYGQTSFLSYGHVVKFQAIPGKHRLWAVGQQRLGSAYMDFGLYRADDWVHRERLLAAFFGLFFGVLLVGVLFSLFLWQQDFNPLYLFYAGYIVNIFLREAYNYSADFGFFPVFQRYCVSILLPTTLGLFFHRFLSVKHWSPVWSWIIYGYALASLVFAAIIGVAVQLEMLPFARQLLRFTDALNLLFTLSALWVVLFNARRAVQARVLLLAFLPISLAFTAILLRNIGILPHFPLLNHLVMGCFIWEVGVFTINFALRHRHIAVDRRLLQLQLALEQKEKELAIQIAEQQLKDRIARDLHDDVAASLSGIRMLSEVVQRRLDGQAPDSARALAQISTHAQQTLENLSDLIWAVKPSTDTLNSLADRIRTYAAGLLNNHDIRCSFDIPHNLPVETLNLEAKRNLHLIAKEAINNALKYSGCTHISISLQRRNDGLHLSVKDNGRGFDLEKSQSGNGLRNMADRAKDIGATLTIDTGLGRGTMIQVVLPSN